MTKAEFKRRRTQLMRMMGKDAIAIIPTAPELPRNRDVYYPFRPDSDFYYLTGFTEPESVAVLIPGRKQGEYVLFCRERDPIREQWDGLRYGQEGAIEAFGADDSFPIDDLDEILPRMLEQTKRVFYSMWSNLDMDHKILEWVAKIRNKMRSGIKGPIEFVALDHYVHDMRLYKSRSEISRIRKAAQISVQGHKQLMKDCKPGGYEYQLKAKFEYVCANKGATNQAYTAIVGGGNNGCILHYTENKDKLNDGDLVLVDAGCEFDHYASDITRTFPVNGRFSKQQRLLYDIVLKAQLAAIGKIKPGASWNEPHEAALRVITSGMIKLGLIKGTLASALKNERYKKFYMHRTSHWLGIDVHDVGDYKIGGAWRVLEPGMVLTVEPGIYIAKGMKRVAKQWQGIGIRIEDDVLVTKDGCEVLTKDMPKSITEIEALMNG